MKTVFLTQAIINAGDKVTVNIEADEVLQVYINGQVSGLPTDDQDQELSDLSNLKIEAVVEKGWARLVPAEGYGVKTLTRTRK